MVLKEETKRVSEVMSVPFWSEDPSILFEKWYDLFPTGRMSFKEKLNSISRLVILLGLLFFIVYKNLLHLVVMLFTLFIIYFYYFQYMKQKREREDFRENFGFNEKKETAEDILFENTNFDKPTTNNPLSNVLLTDYEKPAEKHSAPPTEDEFVKDRILDKAMNMFQESHPNIPDLKDRIFGNLANKYEFERSLQPFYSTAATIIPNDQKTFSEFCYGQYKSCKEGNIVECAKY